MLSFASSRCSKWSQSCAIVSERVPNREVSLLGQCRSAKHDSDGSIWKSVGFSRNLRLRPHSGGEPLSRIPLGNFRQETRLDSRAAIVGGIRGPRPQSLLCAHRTRKRLSTYQNLEDVPALHLAVRTTTSVKIPPDKLTGIEIHEAGDVPKNQALDSVQ